MKTRTSRVGRKPVPVLSGVQVNIDEQNLQVKGPKGSLSLLLHPFINLDLKDNQIYITTKKQSDIHVGGSLKKLYRSIAGTMRAKINNMLYGVTTGFECKLQLVGVGYRAQVKGNILILSLGFSHQTDFEIPQGVAIEVPVPTEIVIKSINKQILGDVADKIRRYRPPEPYKGKGVRYFGEVIQIKETKKK